MLLTFYTFINNKLVFASIMKQSKIAILAIIVIIPLISVILWSNENTTNLETSEDELQVYVSFYPLYETTQAVIGQKADVKILTPPNIDPHDFDPSIKVIQEMKTADLIVLNGGGFESWISNMELDSDQLLDSSNGISFLKTEAVDHHEEHDEHDEHAKEDEHDDDSHTEEFYEEVASVIEEFEHGHMTEIQSVEAIEEILHEHEGDGHGHGIGVIEDIEHLLHEIEDGHIEGSHGLEEIHHLVSGEDVHEEHEEHEDEEEHGDHEGLILANYLQNDAEINGYEFQLGRVIDLEKGSLTLSFARDSISGEFKDGNNIPRMIPARNMYSISYSENDLELKLNLKDVQEQDNISEGETKTEGYEMLDLRINKTYSLNSESDLSISLFANNVLDEVARNHSSFVKDEVPLPGRNFGVKFNLRF